MYTEKMTTQPFQKYQLIITTYKLAFYLPIHD